MTRSPRSWSLDTPRRLHWPPRPTWAWSCSAAWRSSVPVTSATSLRRSARWPSTRRREAVPPSLCCATSPARRWSCRDRPGDPACRGLTPHQRCQGGHPMTAIDLANPHSATLPASPTEAEILGLYRAHLSKGRATLAELFGSHMEVASQGAWLHTSDGERFLNCGGYGVFIMGARHPIVMEAVLRQLTTHPIATRILLEPTVAIAAQALTSITPTGMDRVHFALSGAEAVETGLKLA